MKRIATRSLVKYPHLATLLPFFVRQCMKTCYNRFASRLRYSSRFGTLRNARSNMTSRTFNLDLVHTSCLDRSNTFSMSGFRLFMCRMVRCCTNRPQTIYRIPPMIHPNVTTLDLDRVLSVTVYQFIFFEGPCRREPLSQPLLS